MSRHVELEFHHNQETLIYFTAEGKSFFFCNHGLINQEKYFKSSKWLALCIFLEISPVFCKNLIFRYLAIILASFGELFAVFLLIFLMISILNFVYTSSMIPIWEFVRYYIRDCVKSAATGFVPWICLSLYNNALIVKLDVYFHYGSNSCWYLLCMESFWTKVCIIDFETFKVI